MNRMAVAGLVAMIAVAVAAGASRGQEAAGLSATIEKRIDAHRRAQAALDAWATEKADLETRRLTAAAHIEYLEKRRSFEESQVKALDAAVDGLDAQLRQFKESIDRHHALPDTLAAIVSRLDGFLAADLPFHMEERRGRVDGLKALVAEDSVTSAEKLRSVFEVLDAEAQYAGTVEVYRNNVNVGGETIAADVLRVGRVALFWRSADGTRVGEYDRAAGVWSELPTSNARDIARAIEMGAGARASEIVLLPLGKVQR